MKQTIINILLGVLCILLGAGCVFLFFVNLSLKKEIASLENRLAYEEQLLEEQKQESEQTGASGENTDSAQLVITSSFEADSSADGVKEKEEAEKKEAAKPAEKKKKKKEAKPVDLSNMEILPAQTEVPENQIDQGNLDQYFKAFSISDELYERIYGDDRSFKTYCTVKRTELSYIKVLHYGYDGKIKVGEMIINAQLVDDVLYIFKTLFENKYQIEKMILVDAYGADDDTSVNDNNTSCFNFRTATDSTTLSNHATGCAIDINPLQNPYLRVLEDGSYDGDNTDWQLFTDRTNDPVGRHMINHEDLCYQLFAERGFTWGGDWANPIDYQHFEKAVY